MRSVIALVLFVAVLLPQQALAFSDVNDGDWYQDAITYCEEAGYLDSIPLGDMYEPKVNVSRAMFTVMLVNMAGGQADDSATCFLTDVHPGDWYYGAVCWATANGIIDGYDDNTFRPDKSITRQEMVAVMYRVAQYLNADTQIRSTFRFERIKDLSWVPAWSETYIKWAMANAVITGYTDGSILPGGTTTRAEAAQVVCNFDRWMHCTHSETQLDRETVVARGCVVAGYSGDTICQACKAVTAAGTVIEPVGYHISNGVYTYLNWHTVNGHAEQTTCTVCHETYYTGKHIKKAGCLQCYPLAAGVTGGSYRGNYTTAYAVNNDYSAKVKEEWIAYKGYTSPTNYLVWVNLAYQHVNVFYKQQDGSWKLVESFLCGSGAPSTPTPVGTFKILLHQRGWFDESYTVYNVSWFREGGYAFHSILLYPGTEIVQDGRLGFPVSHGCIRLARHDAAWIYNNIPNNSTVVVY